MSNEFRNFAKPELKEPAVFKGSVSAIKVEEPVVEEVVEELQSEVTANVTEIEPVVEEVIEEVIEEIPVEEPVKEEVKPEPVEEPAPVKGKVIGCRLLNVRVKPNKAAESIGIIPLDSIVTIVEDSIDDWYGIIAEDGVVGYCMREFIAMSR